MNNVFLVGRLTRDPETRFTPNGMATTKFTIAVDRTKEQADFITINTWNKVAENCGKYLTKGSLVSIEGSFQTGSYEKDGKKIYTNEVIANRVNFLSHNKKETEVSTELPDNFQLIDDDDIPF